MYAKIFLEWIFPRPSGGGGGYDTCLDTVMPDCVWISGISCTSSPTSVPTPVYIQWSRWRNTSDDVLYKHPGPGPDMIDRQTVSVSQHCHCSDASVYVCLLYYLDRDTCKHPTQPQLRSTHNKLIICIDQIISE